MSSQGSVKVESRPKPPDRDTTVMEMTTLERIWGKLFEDDKSTKRLGQFLRGIAMHLVRKFNIRVSKAERSINIVTDRGLSARQHACHYP